MAEPQYQVEATCRAKDCGRTIKIGDPVAKEEAQECILGLSEPDSWLICSLGHLALYKADELYATPQRRGKLNISSGKGTITGELPKEF